MKLSVSVTNYSWPNGPTSIREHLAGLAETVDRTAIDTLWVPDHLLQADPTNSREEPMLEAYTILGFLAAHTSRVRLGTMVTAATFREPAVLVKAVTTLDVLSGGRAWLGIGAGYNSDEADALGLFMPPTRERFDRLTEVLQIARRMWNGDESAFGGRYYRLEHPIARPRPIRRPPVLIGGAGERRTLRLVAEYGDACGLFDIPDGGKTVRHNVEMLKRHCADVGRRYEEVERTIATALQRDESVDQFVGRCRALADLGIQHVCVITRGRPWTDQDLAVLAEAAESLVAN